MRHAFEDNNNGGNDENDFIIKRLFNDKFQVKSVIRLKLD